MWQAASGFGRADFAVPAAHSICPHSGSRLPRDESCPVLQQHPCILTVSSAQGSFTNTRVVGRGHVGYSGQAKRQPSPSKLQPVTMLPLFLVLGALIVVGYIAFDLVRVPVGIANSVSIERPLTQVFAFVTDPENVPQWNPRVRSVRLLSPEPLGPGSRWDLDLGPITLHYTMIALEPDVLMAAETRSQVMTNRFEYRFAPQGGQTQVTVVQKSHVRLAQAITIRLKGR